MNLLTDSPVSNILGFVVVVLLVFVLDECFLIEPLPGWVLESILWICLLCPSPWLWKYRFIIGSKLLNFLGDSLISNILSKGFMVVVMMMFLLWKPLE